MSSTRPTRRAAAKRNAVIDSDDDDEIAETTQKPADGSEDDFDPSAASASSRRQSRRKTIEPPATPKRRGRTKRSIAPTEASEILEPDQTAAGVSHEEPTKKYSPRKRKSVAPEAAKMPTPELQPPLPTPQPSVSPEPSRVQASPLADITLSAVNEQAQLADETVLAAVKPVKAMDAVLDKPMDIVLKSRTLNMSAAVEDKGPKPRIVITYLILTNFKSYAGRQEVGPFHASFSSVVGPNGSGKSNVIDSLLFVFGFRASKMRQGKISALIHNSAQYPNIEYCEVAVHFQEVMDLVSFCGVSAAIAFLFLSTIPPSPILSLSLFLLSFFSVCIRR